jgi:hypothetical protein
MISIPSAAPSSGAIAGVFGNHLFELRSKPRLVWLVRAGLIAARYGEQHKEEVTGGVFLFGYFILDKQNKITR